MPSSSLTQTTFAQRRGKGTSAKPKSKKIFDNDCFIHLFRSAYKCGVFFKDLSPNVPLAWLEAMPDAVVRARKEGATDEDVIELLGSNLDGTSYENYGCGDEEANTNCYAQVQNLTFKNKYIAASIESKN